MGGGGGGLYKYEGRTLINVNTGGRGEVIRRSYRQGMRQSSLDIDYR